MWLPLRLVVFSAVKGFVVDLHAEPVFDEVCKLGVLGPVEGFNAQQELVVVGSEDGLSECDGSRTDQELAAEHVDGCLAELPK